MLSICFHIYCPTCVCFATLSETATIHGLCSYLTYWMALTHKWEQSSCANNGTHSSARQLSLMRTSVWSNWTKVLVPNNQNQLSNTISRLDICKQLPINGCRQKRKEGQTKCRQSVRQIVDMSEQLMNIKGKVKEMEREKCSWSSLSGARKSDIYGSIGCSQSEARMTAEKGAGLTWDDFARIFHLDQWASCISLYRALICLYLHRYHCYLFYRYR